MAGLSSFLALVVGATLWAVLSEDPYVAPPPDATRAGVRPAQAAAVLGDLADALGEKDPERAASLAATGDTRTRALLGALAENAAAIPLDDVSFRYVDELSSTGVTDGWSATVSTTWRMEGVDERASAADVRFDFALDAGRVVLAGVGGRGATTPVWMSAPVQVRTRGGVVVVAASGAARYARMARRAVTVVRRVLPRWDGVLVVEVPRGAVGVDAALDVERGTFRNVAGVTAAADGSTGTSAPVHVFLNPAQMRRLSPQGAQVVVSHEAVHVAVDAPRSTLPAWLSEGFADYVALRDVDLPLSTTAAQVIAQVEQEGVPDALPDQQDFDEQSEYFGAAYEASWLACRLLAEREGERTLVRLYRRADGAADVPRVFRGTTGTSLQQFTEDWQDLLQDLAA